MLVVTADSISICLLWAISHERYGKHQKNKVLIIFMMGYLLSS
jgi:hypothetical protein